MIEAGILDGDLVIVQRAQDARNGEIVVALVGQRRVGRRGDRQDVLPRGRPHPPPAGERRARADLRRPRRDPRPRRRGVPGALMRPPSNVEPLVSHARAGARGAHARRLARVPGVRRVRHARAGGRRLLPRVRESARRRERRSPAAPGTRSTELEFGRRPGDRGSRERLEESPDTAGQDAGASQAAKADGKWNRKETASDVSPETPEVRVKRWGKSPPATAATRRLAKPRPVQGEQGPPRGCPPRARVAAKRDGHPRQNPAYRPAKEKALANGAFSMGRLPGESSYVPVSGQRARAAPRARPRRGGCERDRPTHGLPS